MGRKAIKPAWNAKEFPRLANYSNEIPSAWFEEGRNPWTDLLSQKQLLHIGNSLGCTNTKKLDKLGIAICSIFSEYIGAQDGYDTLLSPNLREQWITKNVVNPAKILLESLSPENQHWLSPYLDGVVENGMHKGIFVFDEYPDILPLDLVFRKALSDQPAASSDKPVGSSDQPAASSDKPVGSSDQPAASSDKPVGSSDQPAASSDKPEAPSDHRKRAASITRLELWVRELEAIIRLSDAAVGEIRAHSNRKYKAETILDFHFVNDMLHVFSDAFPEKKIVAKDYSPEFETEVVKFIRDTYEIFYRKRKLLTQQIKVAIKNFNEPKKKNL